MPSAAFFDLDDTLLCENSGRLWVKAMFDSGRMKLADLASASYTLLLHKLTLLDPQKAAAKALEMMRGQSEHEFIAECDRWFAALAEGGQVQMPLGKTFFAPRFGAVADKFGVSWMIIVPPAQG